MKTKELKFHQCQDCGCPGAQIGIIAMADNTVAAECPWCKRKSDYFDYKVDDLLSTFVDVLENWNMHNRKNEEGLG